MKDLKFKFIAMITICFVFCFVFMLGYMYSRITYYPTCRSGLAYLRRGGECVQFCDQSGKAFNPICWSPNEKQVEQVWRYWDHRNDWAMPEEKR